MAVLRLHCHGVCPVQQRSGLSVPLPVGMSDPGPSISSIQVCMGVQPHHGSTDGLKWGRAWAQSQSRYEVPVQWVRPDQWPWMLDSPHFLNLLLHKQWWWFSYLVVSDSCDSMDCCPPGSSVHGILQARILEWVAISFPRRSNSALFYMHQKNSALRRIQSNTFGKRAHPLL